MAIIDSNKTGNHSHIELHEDSLSDGSKVYAIIIYSGANRVQIDCINEEAACKLFTLLTTGSDYLI